MNRITLFFWAIFVQIFILNNIQLSGYINPYYYLIFILYTSSKNSKASILLSSFFIGFIIDIFSNSYGLHAFASVLTAYLKIIWTMKMTKNKDSEESIEIENFSISEFLIFSLYFITIHHFTLFFLERFNFSEILSVLGVTVTSTTFTLFLFFIHKLSTSKRI
ncbi:MAG: rod shape-determining protein MreD [Flavobacteriales bacterium]|nr:rod shape-determining protein MreD [Flavobacteriales bacterium]